MELFKNMTLDRDSGMPLYEQIIEQIISLIENERLDMDQQLPTINKLHKHLNVGRVTVINAYNELRRRGIIDASHGRGFFVSKVYNIRLNRVFLLFDAMNSYKEVLYRSFTQELGKFYQCDIFFHYYNQKQFERFIINNLGSYEHYVILAHFNTDVSHVLKAIPREKLLLLDSNVDKLGDGYAAVYQNFEKDIYNALTSGLEQIKRYKRINFVRQDGFQFIPDGIYNGFVQFCHDFGIRYNTIEAFTPAQIKSKEIYLAISDNDLITCIKHCLETRKKVGRDVGIISYDDTPLKEILTGGITVITTNFALMGKKAAEMIRERVFDKFENPSRLVIRKSL